MPWDYDMSDFAEYSATGAKVYLRVYDLTDGWVKFISSFSPTISVIEAISPYRFLKYLPHTSIAVYDTEFEYGPKGIEMIPDTSLEAEKRGKKLILNRYLGCIDEEKIPLSSLQEYVQVLSSSVFDGSNYSVLFYNSNSFTNYFAKQLLEKELPFELLKPPIELSLTSSAVLVDSVKYPLSSVFRPKALKMLMMMKKSSYASSSFISSSSF